MSELRPTTSFAWLEARVRRPVNRDALGFEVADGYRVLGQVAFEQWSPTAAGVHVAISSPMALRHVGEVMRWFFTLRETAWALVEEDAPSARLAEHLGFVERGRLPGAARRDGTSLVLLAVTRAEFEKRGRHVR